MTNYNKKIRSILEPFILIYSLGTSFIFIAILNLFKIIELNDYYFLAITLSGFLFLIADFLKFPLKFFRGKTKLEKLYLIVFPNTRILLLFGSIFSLILIPNISINPDYLLTNISEFFALLTIGFTIINLSLTHMNTQIDTQKFDRQEELKRLIPQINSLSKQLIDEPSQMTSSSVELTKELYALSQKILESDSSQNILKKKTSD